MSDGEQDSAEIIHGRDAAGAGVQSTESRLPTCLPVQFRLTADFIVEVEAAAEYLQQPSLTIEQKRLFLTILTTPESFNRMCRLAIVSDFETHPGLFEDCFFGPQAEDILMCALPYLAQEDQEFWTRMRAERPESVGDSLLIMFNAFRAKLQKAVIEDVASGEIIPEQVRRDQVL